jgi:hypothetical protein
MFWSSLSLDSFGKDWLGKYTLCMSPNINLFPYKPIILAMHQKESIESM